jgi:hypothetical protein
MICEIEPASIGERLISAGHRNDLSFPDGLRPTAKEYCHPVALQLGTLQAMAETIARGLHKIACSGA